MSADNGVYILVTLPKVDRVLNYEYRIVHSQAIENIYYYKEGTALREAELVRYFGKAEVITDYIQALVKAHELEFEILKGIGILEYGVRTIQWPTVFPTMTSEEAEVILQTEYDRVFQQGSPGGI